MPRGPFVHTARLKTGPGASSPNTVLGDYECRIVTQNGILTVAAQHPSRPYWMTIDEIIPVSGFSLSPLAWDSAKADRVAWPDLDVYEYMVWYTDKVDWEGQPIYYRAALIPIEAPPDEDPLPSGGSGCSTAVEIPIDSALHFDDTSTLGYYLFEGVTGAGTFHISWDITGGDLSIAAGDQQGGSPFFFCNTINTTTAEAGTGCFQWTTSAGRPVFILGVASGTPEGTITISTGGCP